MLTTNAYTVNCAFSLSFFVVAEDFSLSFGQDYWSAGLRTPEKDGQNDLTIQSVNQTGGYTMVDFMRPASTNDMKDVQFTVRSRDTCSRGFLFFVRNTLANLSVRPRPHVNVPVFKSNFLVRTNPDSL